MPVECPRCKDPGLVFDLPALHGSLAPGAELKAVLAPPVVPDLEWIPSAVGLGVGVLLLVMGAVLLGLLALLAGGVLGFVAYRRHEVAVVALAVWGRELYCRHCGVRFGR